MCKQCAKLAVNSKCPAMRALEDLTPSGSEFFEDPQFCYAYVRGKITHMQDSLIRAHKELNRLRKEDSNV